MEHLADVHVGRIRPFVDLLPRMDDRGVIPTKLTSDRLERHARLLEHHRNGDKPGEHELIGSLSGFKLCEGEPALLLCDLEHDLEHLLLKACERWLFFPRWLLRH